MKIFRVGAFPNVLTMSVNRYESICEVEVRHGFDLCLTLNKFVIIVVRLLRKEGNLISNQDGANILLLSLIHI